MAAIAPPGKIALRLTRRFAAARDRVFAAWTTPEALRRWWCPPGWEAEQIRIDLRAGGAYYLGMRRAEDGMVVSIEGQFLEVDVPARLVYTWQWRGAFPEMDQTRVTVEFLELASGTEVVVLHEELTDVPLWQRHRAGWIAACDRMEQIL